MVKLKQKRCVVSIYITKYIYNIHYTYTYKYLSNTKDTNKCSKILYHCQWILLLSLFPLAYYGLYYAITYKITTINQGDYPGIVRISSSGPAAELYPDSLGDYYLLPPDISLNDLPVYKHSVRDDRFIVNIIIDKGNISLLQGRG